MSDTRCCLTKLGLSTQNEGYVSICNQSQTFFTDQDNNLIRTDSHSLKDAWNSPTRKEIDNDLSNGIRHANCQHCWDEEDAGRTSKRQHHNRELHDVVPMEDQPRALLLKPGNICNLGCRHCHPTVSSGWYRDAYKLDSSGSDYNIWLKQYKHIKEGFADTNSGVWEVLDSWVPNLVYYDLYGGEPLLVNRLYQNLVLSADNGYAKNQHIHINTNGTIWRDDFLLVFSKFKSVYFDISADGTHQQFEYMRYPAVWNDFESNLKKYQDLGKLYPSINIGITITVSLYNIYYLPETISYYEGLGFNCGINVLHTPAHMNMRIAPPKLKDAISNKLSDSRYASLVKLLYTDIENSKELYKEFLESLEKIDTLRNQRYKDYFPEMAQLLNE